MVKTIESRLCKSVMSGRVFVKKLLRWFFRSSCGHVEGNGSYDVKRYFFINVRNCLQPILCEGEVCPLLDVSVESGADLGL